MDQMILFQSTPPAANVSAPETIRVPERFRAELFRSELEASRRLLLQYAARHPAVAPALGRLRLLEALALALDDCVGAAIAADVNAFADQTYPGQPITKEMYRQYAACSLERAGDPYRISADWQITALAAAADWSGLLAFFRRYPLARHMVDAVAANFQQSLLRCCDRLLEDWQDLQTFFFAGAPLQQLSEITTTGSDSHKGGGQVLLLRFQVAGLPGGGSLVYKPSDVERDFRIVGNTQALAAALDNLRVVTAKGVSQDVLLNAGAGSLGEMFTQQLPNVLGYTVPCYRILPVWPGSSLALDEGRYPIRKSYGYIEYLSNAAADRQFESPDQIDAFYRAFGVQLGLCWVFQMADLHQENLIVHQHLPYLIDLEVAYAGIMAVPSDTGLSIAYSRFSARSGNRNLQGWATDRLDYVQEPESEEVTKNALYDMEGELRRPTDADRQTIATAFQIAVDTIFANVDAYTQWLTAAQHCVTRQLPLGTGDLLGILRTLTNPAAAPAARLVDEIRLRLLDLFGQDGVSRWGELFYQACSGPGGANSADQVNLIYFRLQPTFSIWFDRQTALDYECGDIPAYYQKMDTPDLLGSTGAPIRVDCGLAVQYANADHQQALSAALIAIWGTETPLLPASYFTADVVEIQQQYLAALAANQNDFRTHRVRAATQNIGSWSNGPPA